MDDHKAWLKRLDELEASIRSFIKHARTADRPEATDALADVLDELRAELLEQARCSRHAVLGRTPRPFHPALRPIVATAERFFRWTSFASAWNAAGLRVRLRST